jgi:DNA-binding SARP family transcriptional activator
MRLGILGPVVVEADGESVSVGSAREAFVLALLVLNSDQVVPVERLIDALWADPPPSARAQVHNIIRNLRRRLNDLIETRSLGYELKLGDHQLDLTDFRRDVARARIAHQKGDNDAAIATLTSALARWRGPALAGIGDELAGTIRQSLHDERLAATITLIEVQLAIGDHQAALDQLVPLLADHPYREYLYELRMRALALDGRRKEALDAYQQAYRVLVDDLGVEPGPDLRRLEREILAGDNLAEPVAGQPVVPRELPPLTAALVGRAKLLGELVDQLGGDQPEPGEPTRIALLVGQGGIGKSALALAAAHRLGGTYPQGTLYANLRGSQDTPVSAHELTGRFLRSLGLSGSEIPTDVEERAARYRTVLADRRVLVVLDDAGSEEQVRPLLPSGAGCGVIVTSRRSLAALAPVPRWTVPPLTPADATELLAAIVGPDRAGRERAAAESIAALCGFLPLAVCVAGAKLAVQPAWDLNQLEERLSGERARLDELAVGDIDVRAGIALTYESLDPACRDLFRLLGLLRADDWPLWVAEALIDADANPLLDQLVDVHLVEPVGRDAVDQARFRLHDLVAEFAREHAYDEDRAPERTTALRRVLDGWLGLASIADEQVKHGKIASRGLPAPPAPERAARIAHDSATSWFEAELPNLFGAYETACEHGDFEVVGAIALRLSGFLTVRAYDEDRERLLLAALRLAPERSSFDLRSRLLSELFAVFAQRGRFAELPDVAARLLAAARESGESDRVRDALTRSAWAANRLAKFSDSVAFLQQAEAIAPDDEDTLERSRRRAEFAVALVEQGDVQGGEPLFAEGVVATRAQGPSRQLVVMLTGHAEILCAAGRYEEALAALDEASEICATIGDELGSAVCEQGRAQAFVETGRLAEAAALLERAVPVLDAKAPPGTRNPHGLQTLGDLAAAERRWADAAKHLGATAEIWQRVAKPLETARALGRLERVHRAAGDEASAARCRTEWRAILTDLGLTESALLLPPDYPASFVLFEPS